MVRRIGRIGRIRAIGLLLAGLAAPAAPARTEAPEPDEARLKAEVFMLASPEFQGRRGEGGRKASEHLVEAFRGLKLEPLFDGAYTQPIVEGTTGEVLGRNVGARLLGADPALRDEWIVVSAHFDHLGVRGGVLFPGADDNASGVAMMLEVARSLALSAEPPKRSVLFLGFDLEEVGLYGSRYFVEHAPVPLDQVRLFITADMIGRALGGVCRSYVFVMGSEHAPGLRPWIAAAAERRPVTVGILGTDMLLLDRSDYGPFRARKIPYLFFSTGENPHYHTPGDTPETLDYPKLEAISRVILGVVRRAASAESVPKWNPVPDHPLSEAVAVRDVFRALLEHRNELKIGSPRTFLLNNTLRKLEAIVARGSITPGERAGMLNAARFVMIAVF